MNDNTAQNPQTNSTYVDDYQPPAAATNPVAATAPVVSEVSNEPENSDFAPIAPPEATDPIEMTDTDDTIQSDDFTNSDSETLEDQNIFFMLGVEDGSDEVKENFLNELQKVIWDDFLENDVNLLITSEEKVKFDELMAKKETSEEIQDALVSYLETLVPDLEDIMLEKALDLKSDLYVERINGLKEYYANDAVKLEKINESEKLMSEEKWYSSAKVLNQFDTK